MPNTQHRNGNDNGGRGRGDRERGDRDEDRPDRDRGAWDDRSRYMEMAPGQQRDDGNDEARWMEPDSAAGRIGRADEERLRGAGYGPQRGYGGGQSGYAAGYSGELPRARGPVSKGEGYAHRTGRDGEGGERATFGSSGYGGGGNTGYEDGNMGYGSLGAGADTSHGGTMGYGSSMGDQGRDRDRGPGRDYSRERERERGMSGWSPGQGQDRGSHRGKGPAGYTRSDERIREDVCDALTEDHHIDASGIQIAVKDGEVTLTGFVPDRRTKRMAEDCIEAMSGVKEVCNNLRVQTDAGSAPRPSASSESGKPRS